VFSFDSLVHVDWEVMNSYIGEFARVLRPGGRAFVHHSNLGHFMKDGVAQIAKTCWRGEDVTAERVRDKLDEVGLACISQEKIAWFVPELVDCISVIVKPEPGRIVEPPVLKDNYDFAREGEIARRIAAIYDHSPEPSA
jgi:SAM-dependent methyltransferase